MLALKEYNLLVWICVALEAERISPTVRLAVASFMKRRALALVGKPSSSVAPPIQAVVLRELNVVSAGRAGTIQSAWTRVTAAW